LLISGPVLGPKWDWAQFSPVGSAHLAKSENLPKLCAIRAIRGSGPGGPPRRQVLTWFAVAIHPALAASGHRRVVIPPALSD